MIPEERNWVACPECGVFVNDETYDEFFTEHADRCSGGLKKPDPADV